jgi:chromosome segregation ATPase
VRWSKHGGSSSRLWLAFSLALALCIFSPLPLHAQTVSERTENSDKPKSIEGWLMDSLSSSAQLRQALIAQRSSRIDLEIAYAALKVQRTGSEQRLQSRIDDLTKQLQDSVMLSDSLRAEIARLTDLLTALKMDSVALSKAFDDYRAEMQRQVREVSRERDTWRVVAIVAGAAAVGFGVYAAVK